MEERVYDKMYQREGDFWWHLGMKKIFGMLLDRYLSKQKGNIILDAGCGTGGFFDVLSKYGQVYGVDIHEKAVGYARTRQVTEVVHARVEQLPFVDLTFDLVFCNDVLYHKSVDDRKALKEFYRVLKPGGILLIKEPAISWLRGSHDRLVWTKRRYSRKKLSDCLAVNKFAIIRASYLNFFLFPLALLSRVVDYFFKSSVFPEELFYSPLSFILKYFLYFEAKLLKHFNFPFGLSVICLAKK